MNQLTSLVEELAKLLKENEELRKQLEAVHGEGCKGVEEEKVPFRDLPTNTCIKLDNSSYSIRTDTEGDIVGVNICKGNCCLILRNSFNAKSTNYTIIPNPFKD